MHRPTIAMRKYDETQYVNIRTYWSLDYSPRAGGSYLPGDSPTYELQVRHNGLGDEFKFISHDANTRDPLELVTQHEYDARILDIREHEDMSHDAAKAIVDEKVAVMSRVELKILDHLKRTWDAFALLFEPAYNL